MATKTKAASKPAAKKAAPKTSAAKKAAPKRKAAPKKKSTPKPKTEAAKAAEREHLAPEQVSARFVRDDEGHGEIVLSVNYEDFTLSEQALLSLRRDVNEIALGFVH